MGLGQIKNELDGGIIEGMSHGKWTHNYYLNHKVKWANKVHHKCHLSKILAMANLNMKHTGPKLLIYPTWNMEHEQHPHNNM